MLSQFFPGRLIFQDENSHVNGPLLIALFCFIFRDFDLDGDFGENDEGERSAKTGVTKRYRSVLGLIRSMVFVHFIL